MGLKEMPAKDGEQLTFKGFELAEVVRALDDVEIQKKEANEEWNVEIKALKKKMIRLAREMKESANGRT